MNSLVSYIRSLSGSLSVAVKDNINMKERQHSIDLKKEQAAAATRLLLIEKKNQLREMEALLKVIYVRDS